MQKITLKYVKIITVSEKYNKKCMHYGFLCCNACILRIPKIS